MLTRQRPATDEISRLIELGRREPRTFEEAHADAVLFSKGRRVCDYLFAHRMLQIRDHELYLDGGFRNMTEYWNHWFADKNVAVLYAALRFANSVPGEVALAYDPPKIDAGAMLLKKSRTGETIITLQALEAITIRVKRDGRDVMLPFARATAEELYAEALRKRRKALPPPPPESERAATRLEKKLGELAQFRIQRQNDRHIAVITVPIDKLAAFEKLLK